MAIGLSSSWKIHSALARGVGAICAALVCCLAVAAPPTQETMRLRIAWGGGTPTKWVGKISLSEGTLSQIQLTGTETDAPGSMWIDSGTVQIASPRQRRVDGFDITTNAPLTAFLRIELASDSVTPARVVEIPLEKLWRGYERLPIDDRGNAALVHRANADYVRIISNQAQLLFQPEEQFDFDVALAHPEIEPGSSVDLNVELLPARGTNVLWSNPQRVPVPVDQPPRVPLSVPLPREEGVYTLRVTVTKPAGFHERWVPGAAPKPISERRFQVVVFDPKKTTDAVADSWRTLLEIDPTQPTWWKRLPDWVWLPAAKFMPKGPLGSAPAKIVDHSQGRFVELSARAANQPAEWQAYPLPIGRPGSPHLIEVEYPTEEPQELGISLVEPNSAGRVVPPGQDSGAVLDKWASRSDQGIRRVQYVCWPRTSSPTLVIRNPSTKHVARFGKLRVLAAGNHLPSVAMPKDIEGPQRLIAAYISRPYFVESLGASDVAAPSGQTVHDLQSYYEAATRLADYLRYSGYNAVVVNVAAEGSAIYPSQVLQRTPRYDRSWLESGAIDLPPADPLELLLRVCDRAGIAVVPALRFDAPLPDLEAARRTDPLLDAAIVCRDVRGRSWHEWFAASNPAAVRYNLLHPRVQQSFHEVSQELIDRYGSHASFAGLGIQLAGGTSATLPSPRWTIDEETLQSFRQESGASWPVAYDQADPLARLRGLSEQDAPFRVWRAKRVTRFYDDLAARVKSSDASRRVVLLTEELFDDAEFKSRIRPRLNGQIAWNELLREAGIELERNPPDARASILRPSYMPDVRQLPDTAPDLLVNSSEELNAFLQRGAFDGAILYQRPAADRLSSFEAIGPFGSERTNLTIVTPPLPSPAALRNRFVASLTGGNSDMFLVGGMLLPRGGEDQQRPLLHLLKTLPKDSSKNSSALQTSDGIRARTLVEGNGTVCLLSNDSPWPVEASATLNFPQSGTMAPFPVDSANPIGELYTAGQHVWTLTVQPFEAVAVRCDVPEVTIVGLRSRVDSVTKAKLDAQLQDLRSRNLSDRRIYSVLGNPSFEPGAQANRIEGWSIRTTGTTGSCTLDEIAPQAGKASLRMQAGDGMANITCVPFANPGTGQLALTAHVRARGIEPSTNLRIYFESDQYGYRQFTTIDGEQLAAATEEQNWRVIVFGVDDLPLDTRGRIQIRLELVGPGELWLDTLSLYDLLFPHDNFYAESSQQKLALLRKIHAAESAHSDGRFFECWQQLNDYWLQYVQYHLPIVQPTAESTANQTAVAPATPAKPPEPPSISERVKQYVPGFLR